MAFCPRSVDSLVVDGLGFSLALLMQRFSILGLPFSLPCFFLGAVALHATALNRNKDLLNDKED